MNALRQGVRGAVFPPLAALRTRGVIVYHIGRCGSTVVADQVASHRRVLWDGEYLEPLLVARDVGRVTAEEVQRLDPLEVMAQRQRFAGPRCYGAEVKPFHLRALNEDLAHTHARLSSDTRNRFVLLERKNLLRKVVSSVVAQQTREFHTDRSPKTARQVTIPIEALTIDREQRTLLSALEQYRDDLDLLRRLVEGAGGLLMSYEEHVRDDPRVGYRLLAGLCGVSPRDVPVRRRRTNPFPLSEIIINLREVELALRGSGFEWMLAAS